MFLYDIVILYVILFYFCKNKILILMNETETNKEIIQSRYITLARYDFSIHEKRILTNIIGMLQGLLQGQPLRGQVKIEKDLWDYTHIDCSISDLGNDRTNYVHIKEALSRLNDRKIEVNTPDGWKPIRLIEMPVLRTKTSNVRFVLQPELVDYFLNFNKGYSKYQLNLSLSFQSVYSMRFYEWISENVGDIPAITIDELKKRFGAYKKVTKKDVEKNPLLKEGDIKLDKEGNPIEVYKLTHDFIDRVVETAKKELDEKSPWTFDYDLIKKGKRIYQIKIFPKYQPEKDDPDMKIKRIEFSSDRSMLYVNTAIKNYLFNECGWEKTSIKNNSDTFKEACNYFESEELLEFIRTKCEVTQSDPNIFNPVGYVIEALKKEMIARGWEKGNKKNK